MEDSMGSRIREMRLQNDWTMEELGQRLGVQKSAINKWEKGMVENIKRSTIKDMSNLFGCSPAWLMFGVNMPQSDCVVLRNDGLDLLIETKPKKDSTLDAAMILYAKYLKASTKTRNIIDQLLEEDDEN